MRVLSVLMLSLFCFVSFSFAASEATISQSSAALISTEYVTLDCGECIYDPDGDGSGQKIDCGEASCEKGQSCECTCPGGSAVKQCVWVTSSSKAEMLLDEIELLMRR